MMSVECQIGTVCGSHGRVSKHWLCLRASIIFRSRLTPRRRCRSPFMQVVKHRPQSVFFACLASFTSFYCAYFGLFLDIFSLH